MMAILLVIWNPISELRGIPEFYIDLVQFWFISRESTTENFILNELIAYGNNGTVPLIGTSLREPHTTLDKFTIFHENNSTAPFQSDDVKKCDL